MSEPAAAEPNTVALPAPAADPIQQLWLRWRQGQRPDIRHFLDGAGTLTPPQVAAVLLVDQRERWITGERLLAESYLSLYPTLQTDLEYAVELIYGEFLLREELGEGPTPAEYLERFPQYAARLRQQLEFHQALELVPSFGARPTMLAPEGFCLTLSTDAPGSSPTDSCWPVVKGYEILSKLGQGGMGVVYQARQRDAHRVVALKMLLAGADAGSDRLVRFRIEIEAAARLQHPHIAPIYEVGEQDGRPYFSMELADGGSLAQQLGGVPLPCRRAAQLLELLARAIHYAHTRGVLHRDLTPGNVLLMADGTPKITDFGLAKIFIDGGTPQTQSGDIMCTPSYMPPEQAAGRTKAIGPASDVYALGAILYELLTGRSPFRAETALETLGQVMSQEPVPPSRLQPHLPRDLVTICLKCLQKEPRQRYGSARELAEDLQRFLSGQPIAARRTGLPEQVWRWCRRKPAVASLTASLVVMVVSGLVGVTGFWLRAERLRQLAETKQTEAEEQRDATQREWRRAEENLRQAKQAVDDCFKLASEDALFKSPAMKPARKLLLKATLKHYEGFMAQYRDDPAMQEEAARIYHKVGYITSAIGRQRDALAAWQQGQQIWEKLAVANPTNAPLQSELAKSYSNLGYVHQLTGHLLEATKAHEKAYQIRQRLVAQHPEVAEFQRDLARSLHNLSQLRGAAGLPLCEEARKIRQQLVDKHPGIPEYLVELAQSQSSLAFLYDSNNQWSEARRAYEQARDLREKVVAARPAAPEYQGDLARSHFNLGNHLWGKNNQKAEALRSYEQARDFQERLVAAYPAIFQFQRELTATLEALGALQADRGQWAEALRVFERIRDIQEKLVAAEPDVPEYQSDLARSYQNIGLAQIEDGQKTAALRSLEKARTLRETLAPVFRNDPGYQSDLGTTWFSLGWELKDLERREEAVAAFQKAIDYQRQALTRAPREVKYLQRLSAAYTGMSVVLRLLERPGEAAAAARQQRELWPREPNQLYAVACDLAKAIPSVGRGKADLTAVEQAERQHYADQAMAALGQAAASGYRNVEELKNNAALAPLRARDDFQKLLAEMEKPPGKEEKGTRD